jgi:hypothetical protein
MRESDVPRTSLLPGSWRDSHWKFPFPGLEPDEGKRAPEGRRIITQLGEIPWNSAETCDSPLVMEGTGELKGKVELALLASVSRESSLC